MSFPSPEHSKWLSQVEEEVIDPARAIVDPHHHLWTAGVLPPYLLEDLWSDTETGHNVEKTVFVECGASYRKEGPEELRSLGEVEFVVAAGGARRESKDGAAPIAAIVSHADLRHEGVADVLDEHARVGEGLFRGIRHIGALDNDEALLIPGRAPEGLYRDADFRRGLRTLGNKGHSFDAWHYSHQNASFAALALAVPDTLMVLDHFGTPIGVGEYANRRDEVFDSWKESVSLVAQCPNVVVKLGGLAMPDCGMGWAGRALPPTSNEFRDVQAPYYLHAIEAFGPERCMFESNFPVDRYSISYPVLFNGFKKIVSAFSEDEKNAMFSGTASRVYRL
jgi:L-fuconolactonase